MQSAWEAAGYVTEALPEGLDMVSAIARLKREKRAVILSHYYQPSAVQDVADACGDSLALARQAQRTEADIIVLCGVVFMGETAKLLNPSRRVLVPDLNAGCSLADGCPANDFRRFVDEHPGHQVITYVNTSAEVKALSDICVTSTNALPIVKSLPPDRPLLFGPDRNLGAYINEHTGRQMVLWDGACHVHERFALERCLKLRDEHPGSELICHPECRRPLVIAADFVGSTEALLKHVVASSKRTFVVATESGILHKMRQAAPDKQLLAAPADDASCACNECNFMKLTTLQKLYLTLKHEWPEVTIPNELLAPARRPIDEMLLLSAALGI